MPGFALRLLAAALVVLLSASAHAQTAPAGWKLDVTPNVWIATSPERVRLAFYPAVKSTATFIFWFEDEGLRRTFAFSRNVKGQGATETTLQPPAPRLLAQGRTITDAAGARTAVYSYGWETPKGKQLVQILLPESVSQESPAYKAAFDEMTRAWKATLAYAPAEKPAG